MDKLERYRQCIRQFMTDQSVGESHKSDVECQLIFDGEHDHYQLLDINDPIQVMVYPQQKLYPIHHK
jgi:hypothetical protein